MNLKITVDKSTGLSLPKPLQQNIKGLKLLKKRSLVPRGGNDRIMTPDPLARDIVAHFRPAGRILEPCCGNGAFLRSLPPCDWCEIDLGRDFFLWKGHHYDWIITNPPYSLFTAFLAKAVTIADNIVFLCLDGAWEQTARKRIIDQAGFGFVEACAVPIPPKPWPQFHLTLGATWIRRGWLGSKALTRLPSNLWVPGSDKMALVPIDAEVNVAFETINREPRQPEKTRMYVPETSRNPIMKVKRCKSGAISLSGQQNGHASQTEGVLAPFDAPQPESRCMVDVIGDFDVATCPSKMLSNINFPPRDSIVGEWFKEGDLGFIYGERGLGKTWLAMHLGRRCAEGGFVACWKVHKRRRVYYIDGEMPFDAMMQRDLALANEPAKGIFYLQHEVLFHTTGQVLNLTNPVAQAALLEKCKRDGVEILILDNLSCLFSGVRENDADAWELVLPWLLELRRNRIAVIFVAHAGRNGCMRGTSRREDAAFWIVHLTPANQAEEIQTGAKFVARFVKNRNATESECPPMEWAFVLPNGETRANVRSEPLTVTPGLRQCLEAGMTGATEIARKLGISKGQVSKLAKQGIAGGWIRKDGRGYALVV